MKTILSFCLVLLISTYTVAQDFQWAHEAGGNGSDQGYDVAVDDNGNSYVCGWFSDTAHFGNDILVSYGKMDVFLAKYDSNGVFQWVRHGYGPGNDVAAGISIDNHGNPVFTGWFEGYLHFGELLLECHGLYDMFVVKYNAEGEPQWAAQAGGEQDNYGNRITVNPENDIIVSGSFRDVIFFGNDIDFASEGDRDIFIVLYDSNGNVQWAKQFGGMGEDRGYGVDCDASGHIFFTGFYEGKCQFEQYSLYSPAITSVYITMLDPGGSLLWVRKVFGGANDFARGFGIGVDDASNVYTTGFFSGKFIVEYQDTLYATGGQFDFDIYTLKFNVEGDFLWADNAGSIYMDQGRDIVVDKQGHSYVTGFFNDFAEFGDWETQSIGMADIFVLKYHPDGEAVWVRGAGGTENDYGYGIDLDHTDNVYISGIFTREALFGEHVVEGWNGHDIFVAKLGEEDTGITYGEVPLDIVVYPNPTSGILNIELQALKNVDKIVVVRITDLEGRGIQKQLYTVQNDSKLIEIETGDYTSGIYVLDIISESGKYNFKFLVQ